MNPRYSLVVPFHNEAGNILPLLETAFTALAFPSPNVEAILVNDGSTDATADEINLAVARWPQCRVITHPHNLGQHAALFAGLKAATGSIVLTMDGDGQNDPNDYPLLLAPIEAGSLDVACGWRVDRHDSSLRRAMSHLGNAVRRQVLKDGLHDAGCQLRVIRRNVVDALFPFDFLQAFLPAIAVAAGYRVGEFPVRHHARLHGNTHFGIKQLWWKPAVAMMRLRRRIYPKQSSDRPSRY